MAATHPEIRIAPGANANAEEGQYPAQTTCGVLRAKASASRSRDAGFEDPYAM